MAQNNFQITSRKKKDNEINSNNNTNSIHWSSRKYGEEALICPIKPVNMKSIYQRMKYNCNLQHQEIQNQSNTMRTQLWVYLKVSKITRENRYTIVCTRIHISIIPSYWNKSQQCQRKQKWKWKHRLTKNCDLLWEPNPSDEWWHEWLRFLFNFFWWVILQKEWL